MTEFLVATTPGVEIVGMRGNDSLTVSAPADRSALPAISFDGGAGYDTMALHGTSLADTITLDEPLGLEIQLNGILVSALSVDAASIFALAGDDLIDASGVETINLQTHAGAGDDEVRGGNAVDIIFGDDGNDLLFGNDGNDFIFGGRGNDIIFGGAGLDFMFGQSGRDEIDGRRRRFAFG